jgi:hypothetical protein
MLPRAQRPPQDATRRRRKEQQRQQIEKSKERSSAAADDSDDSLAQKKENECKKMKCKTLAGRCRSHFPVISSIRRKSIINS